MRAIGYLRVSTDEQELGLDAQREQIRTACERKGWEVEWVEDAGYSGKSLTRPGIQSALLRLADGGCGALVAAKLDRVSRSLVDFAGMMERSRREGWELVVLDCDMDTTTPTGEAMAGMMAIFAQLERRMISQRTKDALAQLKAQGVRLGRERQIPAEVELRVLREHPRKSLRRIAADLNRDGIPTVEGKPWCHSTIQSIVRRAA